ncbi:MAG TPA: hypothetical protein VGE31_00385 [Candidatus Paceibacterota bacterium]
MAQKKATNGSAAKPAAKNNNAKAIGVGVGLTTAAVAAASAYFLYGSKNAAKNRKAVKSWALKAKAEVLEKLEDAKEMTREEYEELVGAVAKAYTGVKNASKGDIAEFTKEMKDHWRSIERAAQPAAKKRVVAKKAAPAKKAPAKKAAKKTGS